MSGFKSTATGSLLISDLFSVKGKIVLITGGGRGIGLMLTESFVRNGAKVIICSRDQDQIETIADSLNQIGPGSCIGFKADLSTLKGVEEVKTTLITDLNLSSLHCLINNSGCNWSESLSSFPEKGWDKVMDLNLKSLFFLTRSLIPLLTRAASPDQPATIINIGSVNGLHPQSMETWSYDISKAAVHHLTVKLASKLASIPITVNSIAPGLIPTKMTKGAFRFTEISKQLPLQRVGTAEDLAGVALLLSSRAGSWITGSIIPVEGGQLTINKL